MCGMSETPAADPSDSPFWLFSLRFYAQEGIAPACLTLQDEAGVDVNRPPALTAIAKDKGNILIAITESGQIWIDRRQVDPRSLRASIERLHGENPQGAIVIQADKNSQNHLLVAVMDAAKAAGVNQIAIATEGS